MPLPLYSPWIRPQPRLRTADDVLEVTVEITWPVDGNNPAVVAVEMKEKCSGELVALHVSRPLERHDLSTALREICREVVDLHRRSGNPFDDLL